MMTTTATTRRSTVAARWTRADESALNAAEARYDALFAAAVMTDGAPIQTIREFVGAQSRYNALCRRFAAAMAARGNWTPGQS